MITQQPRTLALGVVASAIFAVSAGSAPRLFAQEPKLDEGGTRLVLQKIPDIETGIASLVSGTVGPEGEKFFVENLTMFQPAMVVLIAADVARPLKLNLAKFRYDETAWSGDTGDEGAVSHWFRTQGELKIQVEPVNAEPGSETPFYMIAWAAELPGPEQGPSPVEVIESTGGTAGGVPAWVKFGGGIALVAIVAAVFFRLGRKS